MFSLPSWTARESNTFLGVDHSPGANLRGPSHLRRLRLPSARAPLRSLSDRETSWSRGASSHPSFPPELCASVTLPVHLARRFLGCQQLLLRPRRRRAILRE